MSDNINSSGSAAAVYGNDGIESGGDAIDGRGDAEGRSGGSGGVIFFAACDKECWGSDKKKWKCDD